MLHVGGTRALWTAVVQGKQEPVAIMGATRGVVICDGSEVIAPVCGPVCC